MATETKQVSAQQILDAIDAAFAAGARDEWDAPEFEVARKLTAQAGCQWDFSGWRNTAGTVRNYHMLGGVALAAAVEISPLQLREIEKRFGNVEEMDDYYAVAVDGDGSDEETEAILDDLQKFLGADWSCEWAGSGNTDAYGDSTEDITIRPRQKEEQNGKTAE